MNKEDKYKEFAESMYQTYPKMFPNQRPGFEIGEGWYHIIKTLCALIQSHIDWKNEQRDKYQRGDGCPQLVVVQIKEKFGSLRFYSDGGDEHTSGMIHMANAMSYKTCETCGDLGSLRANNGWYTTLCDKHWSKYEDKP